MDSQPYFFGFRSPDSGPLARFLPALEEGVAAAWLARQTLTGNWILDPFGFSPQLTLEIARSGYRVLVTAHNPVSRFLLETFANPPAQSEFIAALADLGAVKKGDERLAQHLQSLYLTVCEKCEKQIYAQAFLWRKGADLPYARVYECKHCGDFGERLTTEEDAARAKRIAATDSLHRARAYEKVVSLKDEDRAYAEEAIAHYLPRPLYALATIVNRLDSLNLPPARKRALTALVLLACDFGNTLWGRSSERPRPKQLTTPNQFRENNVWMALERGVEVWKGTGSPVPCEIWKNKIPESGGILIYEGRLKDLAHEVKKEIPIAAVIGSVPRPNQAFWTLSALWSGWLWGKEAVEPYKAALRRRRYDWAWNATALGSAFKHLKDLLPDNAPFFALLPEPEPAFLTSAFTAAGASGFSLQSVALRTEHDPVQVVWKGAAEKGNAAQPADLKTAIRDCLILRGEPAVYLHIHAAGLAALAESNALKQPDHEFDEALRKTNALFAPALQDNRFIHYSSSENIETGLWGLKNPPAADSLADRAEMAIVAFLQKNPNADYLEFENELTALFSGAPAPSKGLIYEVLNSYAEKESGAWKLRAEDRASARRAELKSISALIESIGKRLGYAVRKTDKLLYWDENEKPAYSFYVLASALINRALDAAHDDTIIVMPGGRAALIAYKQERDPSLKARMKNHRAVKYRLLRAISEVRVLTREAFIAQIANDPIQKSDGQMMMF
ncbi:MAG: hypothetical protein PHQ36_04150 [Anaerolineales bacterium]|nr:hypothetical protein [Anaerolineales bacterium]